VILPAIGVLTLLGLACVFVTDTHYASGHDGPRNAAKQLLLVGISAVAAGLVLRLGYQRLARWAYGLFGVAVVLLVPPVAAKFLQTDGGGWLAPRNGAYRWIHLPGIQIQPSEIMKVTSIMALAWYLRYRQNYRRFSGLLVPFLVSAAPFGLILLEPDLGTVLLLIPVLFTMLFVAGARIGHLVLLSVIGLGVVPVAWPWIHDYQRQRVSAVLLQIDPLRKAVINDPASFEFLATKRQALEWAAGSGYQLVHAKNALGSGGLLGHGWGRGVYTENPILPDRHNDLIFALVGHQWGFLGCLVVLLCYAAIVVTGAAVATATIDPLGRLLASGVTALLATQATISIAMAMGLLPITGITLPFVSYGGSSYLTYAVAMALLISVSQHRPFILAVRPFEFLPVRRRLLLAEQERVGEPKAVKGVRADPTNRHETRRERIGDRQHPRIG
jgi:rod shape determining protein RodA